MSPTNHSKQHPFVTYDLMAAQYDARHRSSVQQIEYVIGVREDFDCNVEYIVVPFSDFRPLHQAGGWLLDDSYGRPITPQYLIAACVCCDIDEAMLDATMRISHGAPPLFIGHRDSDYLVAPIADWPRFSAVGWRTLDEFVGTGC